MASRTLWASSELTNTDHLKDERFYMDEPTIRSCALSHALLLNQTNSVLYKNGT